MAQPFWGSGLLSQLSLWSELGHRFEPAAGMPRLLPLRLRAKASHLLDGHH